MKESCQGDTLHVAHPTIEHSLNAGLGVVQPFGWKNHPK